jgi:preprotein translocase subunit SecD
MQSRKAMRWIVAIGGALSLVACATKRDTVTLRFFEEASTALPDQHVRQIEVPATGQHLTINPFPTLTEKDVLEARLYPTAGGNAVQLRFDLHGANLLNELTTRSRGQSVVILLNERPVAAVLLDQIISNGQFLLEGDFTDVEAEKLVADLNKLAGRPRDTGDVRHAP